MKKYVILISIFNDWKSVFKVLQEIDLAISTWNAEVSILIVNDASVENINSIKLNLPIPSFMARCLIFGK